MHESRSKADIDINHKLRINRVLIFNTQRLLEVNLSAYVYRLSCKDFSPTNGEIFMQQLVNKRGQISFCNFCAKCSPLSALPRVTPEQI